jgi:hypothetical protein
VFGFEKNERDNISARELLALQAIAVDLLKLAAGDLDAQVGTGALQEICL